MRRNPLLPFLLYEVKMIKNAVIIRDKAFPIGKKRLTALQSVDLNGAKGLGKAFIP